MKKLPFILFFFFLSSNLFAQTNSNNPAKIADTAVNSSGKETINTVKRQFVADTLRRRKTDTAKTTDSVTKMDSIGSNTADSATTSSIEESKNVAPIAVKGQPIDSIYRKLLDNPFTRTNAKPIYLVINERQRNSKDEIFYLLLGLLLFLAFIKLAFSRYFKNVFKLFFQPAFRQKQTREQLLQNNLPSLLLNLFFIFSAATYISFLLQYYQLTNLGFWWLLLYTTASLLVIYIGKFILLTFAGWVFDVKEATSAYLFAVYLINKILGVILIPFTLLIAFSVPSIINISITILVLIILLLFIYRYVVSYPTVRRELRVRFLHFIFYISAFEIMPLLLIYKTLIFFLDKTH